MPSSSFSCKPPREPACSWLLFVVLPAEQAPRLRAGASCSPFAASSWLVPCLVAVVAPRSFPAPLLGSCGWFSGVCCCATHPSGAFFGEAALLMQERCPVAACKTPVEVCVPCSDPVAFCHQTCHSIKGHRGSPRCATVPLRHRPVSSRSLGTVLLPVLPSSCLGLIFFCAVLVSYREGRRPSPWGTSREPGTGPGVHAEHGVASGQDFPRGPGAAWGWMNRG